MQKYLLTAAFIAGAVGSQGLEAIIESGGVAQASFQEIRRNVVKSKADGEPAHLTSGSAYDKVEAVEAAAIGLVNAQYGTAVLTDDPAACPIPDINLDCRIVNGVKRWEYEFSNAPVVTVVLPGQ